METAKNEIKKAVIKKDRLNVVYNERFTEANYTNAVTKKDVYKRQLQPSPS